ncbi:hypothetical protein MUO32_21785 [Shinella sp. CPCC 101442]|uniref:capsular polysaccharide export protein, LipB/KpsS family n=1 Tax=Shinella sp. CPCC 101442 TaxID=2932265 RepID=UPI00215210E5|nr:hypothetical protein [Shinella sp. CPCC 101442]MCR6501675.1 hypothetical protein [Shinella sp. CPCC 101442]
MGAGHADHRERLPGAWLPTVLIPHESVFVNRSKYYWAPSSQASIPLSDVILGWGSLQKEIFAGRGYALIDLADIVFVVSSLTGFEALMAGRQVYCYGAPFYSGWGVTVDHCATGRRSRRRTIEDIFHFAYIEASRYVNPQTNERVDVEELVDFVSRKKAELAAAERPVPARLPEQRSLAALSA